MYLVNEVSPTLMGLYRWFLIGLYYVAIKRLAVLFSVLFGALIFHEHHLKERLTGAAVMVAGVFVITLL